MSFSIGALVGYLRLDDAQYNAALAKNASRTKSYASQMNQVMASIGGTAAIVGGLTVATRAAMQYADQVKDGAEQAGLSIGQYQALDKMLRQNGASGDQLTATMTKLRGAVADAANGSKSARDNFRRIGLHFSELINLSPAELLETVAKAMRRSGDDTATFAAAADLLGSKNLPKLNESLKELADVGLAGVMTKYRGVPEQYIRNVEEMQQGTENFGIAAKQAATFGLGMLLEQLRRLKEYADDPDNIMNRLDRWVDPQGSRGQALQNTKRRVSELAEERRLQRAAVADNEKLRRQQESLARVSGFGNAPGSGRSGSISSALQDKMATKQRRDALREQNDALQDQLELVRKQQDLFERGLAFSAANDPLVDYAERIREANAALESGVVTAVAYRNALTDAATAFGSSKIGEVLQIADRLQVQGQGGMSKTVNRAYARMQASAAKGNEGDVLDQYNYIKSLGIDPGVTPEQILGKAAMPDAKSVASKNSAKAKSLEAEVAGLVEQMKVIADKLTVS